MAEKTEKATPKKLRDARKKGQVAKSQDFPSAFTFITSIAAVLVSATYLFQQMGGYLIHVFKSISYHINLENRAGGFLGECILVILSTSLPIAIITACVGVLVNFLVVGPVFSAEAIKFDIKKLNPVTNIKNIFKVRTLVELIKSILKITGAFILIYSVVYNSLPQIIATAAMPILGATEVFSGFLFKVIVRVGIFFIIVAILDLAFQKKNFMKEMKMEKFEVKQEYKDTEGDPQIKGKRKQLAQEIAYQEGPSAARRAKAIVTNPTHLAIALEYLEEEEPSPRILTMGKDFIANKIIQIAQESNVPIMRNVPLAQTLFEKGQIGDYIPEETFEAVAEILQWLKRLDEENLEIFQ